MNMAWLSIAPRMAPNTLSANSATAASSIAPAGRVMDIDVTFFLCRTGSQHAPSLDVVRASARATQ